MVATIVSSRADFVICALGDSKVMIFNKDVGGEATELGLGGFGSVNDLVLSENDKTFAVSGTN